MGTLEQVKSRRRQTLKPQHIVGRSPCCSLSLPSTVTSSQHAMLRWTRAGWEVKDLNSRNGTFVGGERLCSNERRVLRVGDEIVFGDPDDPWHFVDSTDPVPALVPSDGGPGAALMVDDSILVQHGDEVVTAHATSDGQWWLDREGVLSRLRDQQELHIGGRRYRFLMPALVLDSTVPSSMPFALVDHTLHFEVTLNEEQVRVWVRSERGVERDLGRRACFYMLVTLARARLRERDPHAKDAGWVASSELARQLGVDANQLNVDVYRARKSFAQAGLKDAMNVIERRARQYALRIGTSRLKVTRAC